MIVVVRKLLSVAERREVIFDFIGREAVVKLCDFNNLLIDIIDLAVCRGRARCYIPLLFGDPHADERRWWRGLVSYPRRDAATPSAHMHFLQ
jgi:hypothetical protein